MNNEETLHAFYDRIYEIVETAKRDEWDDLIKDALLAYSVEWTGEVGATVEIICGGDVVVEETAND